MRDWVEKTFGARSAKWYAGLGKQTKAVAFAVVVGFILGVIFVASR